MKKIFLYLTVIAGMISSTSCQKFLDVNMDTDQPTTSTPDSLLPAVIGNLAVSNYEHGQTTAYFTQQVATLSGWDKYKDRWDYVDANRIGQWRRHYHDIAINALHVIEASKREGNAENYQAVAWICYANSTLMTTDMFGDIAYSEAFKGKPNAKYDPQSDIYKYLLEDLDRGIALADAYLSHPNGKYEMNASHDNVFQGDIQKWKAYAFALKARASLHLSNYNDAISFAQSALDNGFESAYFDYSTSDKNDWVVNPWGPSKVDPGTWETTSNTLDVTAPTDFIMERVLQFDAETQVVVDPRQPKLMTPRYVPAGGDPSNPEYLYVVSGTGKVGSITDEEYPNLYNSYMTSNDSKLPFMTKEELYFIMSEAYYNSDKNQAFNFFKKGILANMENMGVASGDAEAYLESSHVPQIAGDLTLSNIMMQKVLATYLQGETWVDMRRHGYNNQIYRGLERPHNLVEYFDDDPSEPWIQRLPYDTETEEIYNKDQLVEMGAYQNPEWLKKKMIWAK